MTDFFISPMTLNSVAKKGNINLYEKKSTKINITFLAFRKRNIQAFLENNMHKGIVRLNNGYFGHILNKWSISDRFHSPYSHRITVDPLFHTDMHTLTARVR